MRHGVLIWLVSVNVGVTLRLPQNSSTTAPPGIHTDMAAWWGNIATYMSTALGGLKTTGRKGTNIRSINVVMSTVGRAIPKWAAMIKDGRLGRDVTMSLYAKLDGLAEEVVLEKSPRFIHYGIPNHGHNEFSYIYHMAKRYDSLADAVVFMKTNEITRYMMDQLVGQTRTGHWPYISHPWTNQNLILFNCDERWKGHELYDHLPCEKWYPIPREHHQQLLNNMSGHRAGLDTATYIRPQKLVHMDRYAKVRPGRPPLVWSGYFEGLFSVHAPLIRQYPRSFYEDLVSDMSKMATDNITEHDGVICGLLPLLFQEEYNLTSAAWAVSPSYVLYKYSDSWATPPTA